jgi:glycosyltransferase involved in cell wall biosynthesis
MHLVFFAHPDFLGSQSMPRFAKMLSSGMEARGHRVEMWWPQPKFFSLPAPRFVKKWLGYVDQYFVFPGKVRKQIAGCSPETLFVFTDQALGPWVPLVKNRAHAIHCHDFMAQWSALGEVPENRTGWPGRKYQQYIRKGYSIGKKFISVSKKTRSDLHAFLPFLPAFSEVVYNGMNRAFSPQDIESSRTELGLAAGLDLSAGYLLHIGGNQWYKNRSGVIMMYETWREKFSGTLPLLLIGEHPDENLLKQKTASAFGKDIHFLPDVSDAMIPAAYSGASVFLFPSLDEGFGWPIVEAMACGCPVVTTNEAPMTEVAADAAFLVPRMPGDEKLRTDWREKAASVIQNIISMDGQSKDAAIEKGIANAARFDANVALDRIESIYKTILRSYS